MCVAVATACGDGAPVNPPLPEQRVAGDRVPHQVVRPDASESPDVVGGRLTVQRHDGSAVEGARVAIALAHDNLVWIDHDGSDASGHVLLPGIHGIESAYIHVTPPEEEGHALLDADVPYFPGRDALVQLDVESVIAGVVVDADGHPIEDVLSGRVHAPPDTWPSAAKMVFSVAGALIPLRARNDGSFSLAGLPPATGTVTVTLPRKGAEPLCASMPATPGEPVDVRLSADE